MSRSINFCCWPHQLQWCPGLWILFPSVFQYLFFVVFMLSWMLYFIPISNRFPLCLFLGFISHVGRPVFLIMPCPFSLFLGNEAFCFFSEICRLYRSFRIPFLWLILLFLLISCFPISSYDILHCNQSSPLLSLLLHSPRTSCQALLTSLEIRESFSSFLCYNYSASNHHQGCLQSILDLLCTIP